MAAAAAVVAAAAAAAAAEAIDRCVWLHTRIRSSAALSRWVFSVPLSPRSTTGFPSAEVVAVGQGGQLGGLDSHDRIDVELRKSFEARESRSGDAAGAATLGPVVDLSGQQLGDEIGSLNCRFPHTPLLERCRFSLCRMLGSAGRCLTVAGKKNLGELGEPPSVTVAS